MRNLIGSLSGPNFAIQIADISKKRLLRTLRKHGLLRKSFGKLLFQNIAQNSFLFST